MLEQGADGGPSISSRGRSAWAGWSRRLAASPGTAGALQESGQVFRADPDAPRTKAGMPQAGAAAGGAPGSHPPAYLP